MMEPKLIKLFHLDDDVFELRRIKEHLSNEKGLCRFDVSSFETKVDFLRAMTELGAPHLALLDLHLGAKSEGTGIEFAEELKSVAPQMATIIHSSDFAAIRRSILSGVDDFVLKTEDLDDFALRLFTIFRAKMSVYDLSGAAARPSETQVIGATMQGIAERLVKIQKSAIRSIHVVGESGTGKEVVADLLEARLPSKTPLLRVNCAAIAPSLLESELFGHSRGAFTGATSDKAGYLEAASGGWIFLDEIACLSSSAQAALLRAIEQQQIIRVGESKTRPINVKILSATNIPLEALVSQKLFRNDLFQRLREAEIQLPPLRERRKEIKSFIDHFCKIEDGGPYRLAPEVKKILEDLDWTNGNVRELRNCIRAMTEHHTDKLLTARSIPDWIWKQHDPVARAPSSLPEKTGKNVISFSYQGDTLPNFDTLSDLMLAELVRMLMAQPGFHSLRRVATALGMARTTLSYRLKRMTDHGMLAAEEVSKLNDSKKGA